ncbi:MAG: tripartite tricarboxylate transporter substrate binding protein [Alphaproteobacteria bacterium]|nr:tripartite tricarboxylate transporter substrate binding protein [Alphaproteobacteria bacterium]
MKNFTRRTLTMAALGLTAALALPMAGHAQAYPEKAVQITVPFGAGGGTDTFVRTIQPFVEKQLGADLVVLNVPGAGSVTGSRGVISKDPDGYSVLVNHATLLTNMAVGKADFDVSSYELAASTTSIPLVVAVPASSAANSLDELKALLSGADPVIAGVNIGAVNHFAMLMLEAELGAGKFRYVQTGGGAKTIAALLGEQIAIGVLSGAEAKPLLEAGEVKVIAALSGDRIPYLADVATAAEQGADVDFSIEHSWYFPKDTPADAIAAFSTALEKAIGDAELQAILDERGITPTYFGPEAAPARVAATLAQLKSAADLIEN